MPKPITAMERGEGQENWVFWERVSGASTDLVAYACLLALSAVGFPPLSNP